MPGPLTLDFKKLLSQRSSSIEPIPQDVLQDMLQESLQDPLLAQPTLQRQDRHKVLHGMQHGVPKEDLAMLRKGGAAPRRRTMSATGAELDGRLLRSMVEDPVFGKGATSFAGLDRPEDNLPLHKRYSKKMLRGAKNKVKGQGAESFFKPTEPTKAAKVGALGKKGAVNLPGAAITGSQLIGLSLAEQLPFVGPTIGATRDAVNATHHTSKSIRARSLSTGASRPMLKQLAKGSSKKHARRATISGASAGLKVASIWAPFPGASALAGATASGGGQLAQHGVSKARATRLRAKTEDGALLKLLGHDESMLDATMDYLAVPPAKLAAEDRKALGRAHSQSVAPLQPDDVSRHMKAWTKKNPPPQRASELMGWSRQRERQRSLVPSPPQGATDLRERMLAEMKQSFSAVRGIQELNPDLATKVQERSMRNPGFKLRPGKAGPNADPWDKVLAESAGKLNKQGQAVSQSTLRPSLVDRRSRGESARLRTLSDLGSGLTSLKDIHKDPFLA